MDRRGLAWVLALPLMIAGSLLAHSLAYRIVAPASVDRLELLDGTGHGYLAAVPFVLGAAATFLLTGILAHAVRARRGRSPVRVAAWPLALLPPLGFAVQEHLERLVSTGGFPLDAATEPSFLLGLAFQVPFALAALLAARMLGRAATAIGRALERRPPAPSSRQRAVRLRPASALLRPLPALAVPGSERGPPR